MQKNITCKTKRQLIINDSGYEHRRAIRKLLLTRFPNTTYHRSVGDLDDYYGSIRCAQFVLCPSGMGWDTYRLWESK